MAYLSEHKLKELIKVTRGASLLAIILRKKAI